MEDPINIAPKIGAVPSITSDLATIENNVRVPRGAIKSRDLDGPYGKAVKAFLLEEMENGEQSVETIGKIHSRYLEWAAKKGMLPMSTTLISKILVEMGYVRMRRTKTSICGLKFIHPDAINS